MYEREHEVAVAAVEHASRLCRQVQAQLVKAGGLIKDDRSPVTIADFGVQASVSRALAQAFPDDPLIGEEDAEKLRQPDQAEIRDQVLGFVQEVSGPVTEAEVLDLIDRGRHSGGASGRAWTLDPIDGTKGFLRGQHYAVALALIEDGEVVVGVLGCPNLDGEGRLLSAVRGQGARGRSLSGGAERELRVAEVRATSEANFCESVESGHSAHGHAARIAELLGVTRPPLRIDSQCKYAVLARGEVSIYLRLPTRPDYREKIWDHAAGSVVVEEAGGRVSDVRGRPLDFARGRRLEENRGIVATSPAIHDQVLEAVAKILR